MALDFDFTLQNSDYDNLLFLTLSASVKGVNAAPAQVWFECASVIGAGSAEPAAGAVYDPQFHDILIGWDFDDAADAAPTGPLNMPDAWKDLNKGYGRKVAHVYRRPGTYTATCYAYEPATRRFGSMTIQVTVGNADAFFTGSMTIIFNPGGGYDTSAWPGATVVTTDWAGVVSARNALGVGSLARILIAPGVTLTEQQLVHNVRWGNIWIEAIDGDPVSISVPNTLPAGSYGVEPIFDYKAEPTSLLLSGLNFTGDWDATTETGRRTRLIQGVKPAGTGSFAQTITGCSFDGLDLVPVTRMTDNSEPVHAVLHDSQITNWADYGAHGGRPGVHYAFLGCSIAQHADALSGGYKNGLYNGHGPIRDFGSDYLSISVCDLFSRNGWFPGVGGTDTQPCLRVNTNGQTTAHAYIDRLCAEGGIDLKHQSGAGPDIAMNAVFDKVLQVNPAKTIYHAFDTRYSGISVRNMLGVVLDAPSAARNLTAFLHLNGKFATAEALATPIRVYNSSFVDLRSDANAGGTVMDLYEENQGGGSVFSNVTIENNVFHEPARTGVSNADAPVDLSSAIEGFASRDKGPRFGFLSQSGALSGDVPDQGSLPEIPYSEIRDTIFNANGADNGAPTDQAYWLANAGTRHAVSIHSANFQNPTTYLAHLGEIGVTFGATGVSIRNLSGKTWDSGLEFSLKLDRPGALPGFDPQYDTSGQTVPLPVPHGSSPAVDGGDSGDKAVEDIQGRIRPRTGRDKGALDLP